MSVKPLLLLAALACLAPSAAGLIGPGAPGAQASGGGIWWGTGPFCAHVPAPAPVTVEASQGSTGEWTVLLQSPGDGPCGGVAADACRGLGTLRDGIALEDCLPFGREGVLGPMSQVLPCQNIYGCEFLVEGPVATWGFGGYDGTVVLAVAGSVLL